MRRMIDGRNGVPGRSTVQLGSEQSRNSDAPHPGLPAPQTESRLETKCLRIYLCESSNRAEQRRLETKNPCHTGMHAR